MKLFGNVYFKNCFCIRLFIREKIAFTKKDALFEKIEVV